MTTLVVGGKTRTAVSWAVVVTVVGLIAAAVRMDFTVNDHERRLQAVEGSVAKKEDVQRVEDRVIRIEDLLLKQTNTGR